MEHKFIRIMCTGCFKFHDIPVYCGDRFCPICSVPRYLRVRNRLRFLIDNIDPPSGYCLKHLTLTIKNQTDLSLMTSEICKSFKELRKTKSWKSHVNGGAFVIEVTGSPGSWHVHIHAVIEAKYYKWKEIHRLWMKLSSGRGVWIDNIPRGQAVHYLTKYLSKSSITIEGRSELNAALKGTRLFQVFGTWFKINRKYVKPPMRCPDCNHTGWILYSDCWEGTGGFFTKEVQINSP